MRWCTYLSCLLCWAAASSLVVAQPSEKIPTALRQIVSLEFDNLSLDQCAERLNSLSKVSVIVHESLRPLLDARARKLQMDDSAAEAAADPSIASVELDRVMTHTDMVGPQLVPNDPLYAANQWHIARENQYCRI